MKIAVLKPDHIGDLVLSLAAIRALLARVGQVSVFVSSRNMGMARVLLGDAVDLRPIDFAHLSKDADATGNRIDLLEFDLVVFLRHDNIINPAWAELRCRDYVFPVDSHDHHQSMLDYGVVAPLIGHYEMDRFHFGDHRPMLEVKAAQPPKSVGLCIGSGFHANTWPFAHWLTLGRQLRGDGQQVHVICGPSEAGVGAALAEQLGLPTDHLIVGGADLGAFLKRLESIDRIVASDGGAAHLCSLRVPVLSIFGPSPFRRYAPFGRWNQLLTRNLSCSPCCQWAAKLVNGCLSVECMGLITAADANAVLYPQGDLLDTSCRDVICFRGVSHIDAQIKCAERLTQQPTLSAEELHENASNKIDRVEPTARGVATKARSPAANSRKPAPAKRRQTG